MNIDPTNFKQKCDEFRTKVFSSVAHDVKTPLSCIIGSLQTLDQMQEKLTPEQRDMLIHNALTEAHRLDALFAAMLDEAKPE